MELTDKKCAVKKNSYVVVAGKRSCSLYTANPQQASNKAMATSDSNWHTLSV